MIAAVIQARMGSTRLLGKVMMLIEGKPMLCHVVQRAYQISGIDTVVVATTVNREDDAIAEWCVNQGVPRFCGSAEDVLDRYYRCALDVKADTIMRICADCPLLDPVLAGLVLAEYRRKPPVDYCSNATPLKPDGTEEVPRTFPDGFDVEVFSFDALKRAWESASDPHDREHVTPWIVRNLKTRHVKNPRGDESHLKWSVDTMEDLERVRQIMKEERI